MATNSSTLAWKIPGTQEPGRLRSMGSLRVRHDWATSLSLFLSCIGERNGNPLQCSCLENPRVRGTWWAAIYGVAQSRTQLKQLSSSSSIKDFFLKKRSTKRKQGKEGVSGVGCKCANTRKKKARGIGAFPSGPVVKTLCSQCRGSKFDPWSGN